MATRPRPGGIHSTVELMPVHDSIVRSSKGDCVVLVQGEAPDAYPLHVQGRNMTGIRYCIVLWDNVRQRYAEYEITEEGIDQLVDPNIFRTTGLPKPRAGGVTAQAVVLERMP